MSNSTPRAALPPLPEPFGFLEPTGRSPEFHFLRRPDERGMPVYTAEQVEQIRRETVMACASVCLEVSAEYGEHDEVGAAADCNVAILALLPVKEPK